MAQKNNKKQGWRNWFITSEVIEPLTLSGCKTSNLLGYYKQHVFDVNIRTDGLFMYHSLNNLIGKDGTRRPASLHTTTYCPINGKN